MSDASDPVPPLARDILSLFSERLADHRFGDIDHAALEALADRLRSDAQRVEEARGALDDALVTLEGSRGELLRGAERGLAYARVFARDDAELAAQLDALDERRAPKKKPKRRAAKKGTAKVSEDRAAELPFVERPRAASGS